MTKKAVTFALILLLLLLGGCGSKEETPAPTPKPTPASSAKDSTDTAAPGQAAEMTSQPGVFISELLLGAAGNNNLEFIELYNAGAQAVDLNGWSLWYLLNSGQDEKLIYAWEVPADIPGHGHLLLNRAEQEIGLLGDAEFDVALFDRKGGLTLRDAAGETADVAGWGEAPEEFVAGSAAPAPDPGSSLERLPGGPAGNGQNTADNAADFTANASPDPQNSGSQLAPLPGGELLVTVDLPENVEPGSELEAVMEVQNLTGQALSDLKFSLPIPAGFELVSWPAGAEEIDGRVEWTLSKLADQASDTAAVVLQSPWTYLTDIARGAYVETADWPLRGYSAPQAITVAGGSIPIASARTLTGKTVTIEGTATMYTDAFYAGSTGTKFYLEDESGGIQVFCPGGLGIISAGLGDQIRVTGEIKVYRNAVEIIPGTYPDDVEILEEAAAEWEPTPITIKAAGSDDTVVGRLNEIKGTITRIQEFSYSYEVDLIDQEGNTMLLYIEKETKISIEPLELGQIYHAAGISEMYDTAWQLKPRIQDDFVRVYPPELMLELMAQNSVLSGGAISYTLTAYNYTEEPLTNVRIAAVQPDYGAFIHEILDDGEQEGAAVVWTIPELAAEGGSATVRYTANVSEEAQGRITTPAAAATADQWPNPVNTPRWLTFIGSGVPIWAIQGDGAESPYVRGQVSTEGVVTGVFPELAGFWIQQVEAQTECPQCSSGVFVLVEASLEINVELGDMVQLDAKVRERSGQTMLHLLDTADLTVVGSGNELPAAVELDPPRNVEAATVYYEALEGMLVQVTQPAVVVAPTTKYGETVLVSAKWDIERAMRGDEKGLFIFADDGSAATHYGLETLPYALKGGDTVTSITGPLAFSYDNYKIEPIALPEFTLAERPLPTIEAAGSNQFSVATFNVENLFDFQDPHPNDPPLPSLGEYRIKLAKTAKAIRAMGAPTIVGLQEVENIGILEDLIEQDAILEFDYQPFLIDGTDSRGIDVGYLVRSDRATVQGAAAYPAPEGLTSRPPLVISVTLQLEGNPTVYILNNHFTSMSGGEAATEPRRNAQALWNVTLVQGILEQEPDALIVVMGDLNSFYDALPLDSLRKGGLEHVYELVEPERPYSYIYQGESETLDHILVTPALYQRLTQVEVLHINADYPFAPAEDTSPQRVSDHDPVVAVFTFE